jgi:hypothetical protein
MHKDANYKTIFEKKQNQSATYKETIAYYSLLAKDFPSIKNSKMGLTDSGERLH